MTSLAACQTRGSVCREREPGLSPGNAPGALLYGYVSRTFTSRKIEAATYDSIPFRFLAGNTHPDHSSLAEFRKRFQGQFKDIFKQVLVLAYEMGLAKENPDAAVDGSKHSALSYGHALKMEARIEKEIEQLLADAKKAESDHEELPVGLNFQKEIGRRKDLLTDIAEAKAKIELRAKGRDAHERAEYEEKMARHLAREALKEAKRKAWEAAYPEKAAKCAATEARKKAKAERQALTTEATETVAPAKTSRVPKEPVPGPRPCDQVNWADEESRIMPVSGGGYEQCYNAQAAVATGTLLVLATTVTQATNDKQQIVPMLEALSQMPACLGSVKDLTADTGYHRTTNANACEDKGITPMIAAAREHHHPDPMARFTQPPPLHHPCPMAPRRYKGWPIA
jgi:transposase